MNTPPPWPGVDPASTPYALHLRSIARLAKVAEEARQWMVEVGQEKPLPKAYNRVPSAMAARWLEACQDAYASSHDWGPACVIEAGGQRAHIYVVNSLLQAINEAIEHAADYLGTTGEDRFVHGARAASMAARAVSEARVLCG